MAWSFCGALSVTDRNEGAPMNHWSPYLLSILIIAAFVYMVHGTQKLFGFLAPFPVATPSSAVFGRWHYRDFRWIAFVDWTIHSTRRLNPFRRDGCCHAPQGFWPLLNDGEVVLLYCFIFLYLASTGGGPEL
jgi:putative oxidoreductase